MRHAPDPAWPWQGIRESARNSARGTAGVPSGPRVDGVMSVLIGTAAPLIDPEKFRSWIMHENDHLLVLNKPAQIVCHPSKRGPRSSLAGAVTVDQPLGPDPDSCVTIKSKVVAPGTPGAQPAVTHFEPVAHGGGYTLTRIRLETGRKHQIRVQCASRKCPIVGDRKTARQAYERYLKLEPTGRFASDVRAALGSL